MAEPVTKKIDALPAMTDAVATNDKLMLLDVSAPATTMTKLITMNQVRISAPAQLDANVVENAKIKDGAISTSKLDQTAGSQAVATGTIRDNAVTFAKVQDVDGYSVVGRSGSTAGDANEITAGVNTVLGRVGSGNVAFNKLATTQLANTNARTVIGNATNASATPSAIASNTDGHVLRQNGDTIGFGTLTDKSLATGAVTAGKIASGGISASSQFVAQVVDTNALKNASVTTAKLGNLQVTSDKLATGAVTEAKLGTGAVTEAKLGANSVTEAKLGTIKRTLFLRVTAPDDTLTVGSTTNFFPFPISLNDFIVVDARINLVVASSSGAVTIALLNQGGTMTTLSLAAGATGMSASGTISTSYRTAKTNNFLGVNVTAAGTGAKGLSITLVLQGVPA